MNVKGRGLMLMPCIAFLLSVSSEVWADAETSQSMASRAKAIEDARKLVRGDLETSPAGASASKGSPEQQREYAAEAAKAMIAGKLQDPWSARFSNIKVWPDKGTEDEIFTVCGYVDAKNRYGSYTGEQLFYALVAVGPQGRTAGISEIIDDSPRFAHSEGPLVRRFCQLGR